MKYLIFAPAYCSFLSPAAVTQVIDDAVQFAEQGHEVTLAYCDNSISRYCGVNTAQSKGACKTCRLYMHSLLKAKPVRHCKGLNLIKYTDHELSTVEFSYNSVNDIKNIYYKGVAVGLAAYSSFLSISRNLYPKIDSHFRNYFDKLLQSACNYTDFTLDLVERIKPDIVCGLNSRAVYSRPVRDITRIKGIPYECWEGAYDRRSQYRKTSFGDSTPHDPETNRRLVEEKWSNSALPEEERAKIGEEFYYKRRNSIPAGDKLYVKNQLSGKLPDDFDTSKHNILILNSSEDEYASISEDFSIGFPFQSQYIGIRYISDALSGMPDYHLYLRIHPNLKGISYLYHTKLYELEKDHPNLTVIPPESPISTYSMIDVCEKILVFGSMTGPEATYWGKPVILMYNSLYAKLDMTYNPHTPKEVIDLITTEDLPAKSRVQAIKFGYFMLNDENKGYKYLNPERSHMDLFGRSFDYHIVDAGAIRSKWLIFLQTIGKYLYYKHLDFPNEEDPAFYEK